MKTSKRIIIVGGVADVPGRTMFEKMQHLAKHQDDLRKRMLREPRGYPAANCNLVLPPCDPQADAGFVIMEQVEYPPMSGTNTICVVTALLETGMLTMREPVTELTLEAPAGLVRVQATCRDGKANGACAQAIAAGLAVETSDGAHVTKSLTDSSKGSGMASQILVCAHANKCASCFP